MKLILGGKDKKIEDPFSRTEGASSTAREEYSISEISETHNYQK